MSRPLLDVKDLFCERDDRVLFENLSFSVSRGEVLQIEGPNGSGKTTLLRILSGLSKAFEGELIWNGQALADVRDDFLEALLYFGHLPGVKATLTPEENLRWYAALHPQTDSITERIFDALSNVGLYGYEDVPCHSLSAGQNRRVSLARLYLSRAPLWILDEPFTAIDKRGVAAIEALVETHSQNGGSVILTTHHDLAIKGLRQVHLGGENSTEWGTSGGGK
ncbi:cytochrome c biogenesis heme-transporting ATPase CcmA [Motiliproteus sp. MSK22-1]|uniref:cytochrome c biogenesis heme-transporting ATPase CcmA n=1 Tax=Motiliproteus sp. MSK22-1 TaxID=1897630 RepID=UPI00097561BB|nr:cytochrome c biogenesis heme-transporting ATPase CcmA [Motiliproteus sp. MSK22-1]OMH30063.1 heme ABC transporter ATP-binding protein CcmA [Motiliproteus sp. MSK22-1]